MTAPQNPPQPIHLYQLQEPFNSAIANLSLGLLEDDIRRILHASKRFPYPQSVAVVAGQSATLEAHVRRALAQARRIDVTALSLWPLVTIETQVWSCADFFTRTFLHRAVSPFLRATLMSRSAIVAGATGEWFFDTDEAPPADLLAPCPSVKRFIERSVCSAHTLENAIIEVSDRRGRPYVGDTHEGVYRVVKMGRPEPVF